MISGNLERGSNEKHPKFNLANFLSLLLSDLLDGRDNETTGDG